ncbi:MAG: SBBP repeat-containing protein [Candidatus Firestonebacteria bacterium]
MKKVLFLGLTILLGSYIIVMGEEISVTKGYGNLPLYFIENQGQADKDISYYAKISKQDIYLASERIIFSSYVEEKKSEFSLNFIGANKKVKIGGENKQEGKVNYFVGKDTSKWRRDISTYKEVVYHSIYPNIDLKLYGNGKYLEYEFIIGANADINVIKLEFKGIENLKINNEGDLVISTDLGEIIDSKPYIYQIIREEKKEITGSYCLLSDNSYSFKLGKEYNPEYPVVIDPVLTYSTYFGGSSDDYGRGIAVDSSGNIYITGNIGSTNFPVQSAYQGTNAGGYDAFITKINATGDALIYSTYLGGSGFDYGSSIAVDSSRNVYITGWTTSTNFPVQNAYQGAYGGGYDAFITKINASGNALIYSTYLGGNNWDYGYGIAIDSSENAYVTGFTKSTNFPVWDAYQRTYAGGSCDAFITKINASGNALTYSTYLGGSDDESGSSIAVDNSGNAYVTGFTKSTNFPVRDVYQGTNAGDYDVFITKINSPIVIDLPANLNNVKIYPNPFNPMTAYERSLKMINLPSNSTVSIYNVEGVLIMTLTDYGNVGSVHWDGKNNNGELVSRGVYIYLIQDDKGNKLTGKIAIIY